MLGITGLKHIVQGAAVALALSALPAQAASVTPTVTATSAYANSYSFGALTSNNTSDTTINLASKSAYIDAFLTGMGSLTIPTYANPFRPGAIGLFDLLDRPGASPLPPNSVIVEWGSATADLSDLNDHDGSTAYSMGMGGSSAEEDLVFTWSLGSQTVSLSAILAAVPAPAGLILLLTALGGIAAARRRTPKAPAGA